QQRLCEQQCRRVDAPRANAEMRSSPEIGRGVRHVLEVAVTVLPIRREGRGRSAASLPRSFSATQSTPVAEFQARIGANAVAIRAPCSGVMRLPRASANRG